MLFNSIDFIAFFAVVFLLQWVLPHRPRNLLLLAASYFFYGCWDWRFLSLLFVSTVVDYHCAAIIDRSESQSRRKLVLALAMTSNLTMLGFFKYANFFVGSAVDLFQSFGLNASTWHLDIVLPVGISFYTFQTMSYTIDVYRRELKPIPSFVDFALFVTFFPQLVAGPIERAKNLAPQMTRKTKPTREMMRVGIWLVLWGFFKKLVIADNMAPIVDQAFDSYQTLSGGEVLVAVYAFAFQIYADFSGYTDIARGTAKMMGYELMLNFRLPYFATNPSDFWRRWHISLSSWLRDYLYVPLGGNRKGPGRTYVNLFLTMLLGGLWHGAAWTYVIWGAYHGALLVGHRLATPALEKICPTSQVGQAVWWCMRVVVFFHLVCLGWLIFRAESVAQVVTMLSSAASAVTLTPRSLSWLWQIAVLCSPLFVVQLLQGATGDTNAVLKLSVVSRSIAYATLVLMILALGAVGSREFIYFQF